MTKDKTIYTKDSIESLSPLQFTRLRPNVYCGDTSDSTQLLVEIISNSIDEYRLGHGSKIDVTIKDTTVIVQDYGQGFLVNSMREDGKTILEAAFSVLNTSGKYREDGAYEGTSLGSFGIGSKLATFLSHWLEVITYRDNKYEHIWFKEGVFDKRECGKWQNGTTGTLVQWNASEEFFADPKVSISKIKDLFSTIVCLCPGLTITLDDNGSKSTYFSENGLKDLVDSKVKDKEIIDSRLTINIDDDKNKLDFIMTYTSGYSLNIIPYVNTGLTETGPHITQIKALLTREFNKFFREKKMLKESDDNLAADDIQEGMYIVFNITAPGVTYDAQVKSRVTKIDMKPFLEPIALGLQNWLNDNENDMRAIVNKALIARKAREAAKKAKEAARNIPKEKKKNILNLPTKLVDCWSKDRSKCELLISEGDSAGGGLIGARDSEIQAIFPIRGKLINLFKATDEKTFANQEVINIIKAIGLDFDSKTHKMIYDIKKLRYGKIILCCDADPDGQAIKNLLLTYFWSLCPDLLINNHIYVAVPPLFRITNKKNEYTYLRDAAALEQYKASHLAEKFQINRNKGLGEQDPEELAECLLNPATRHVELVSVADYDKADKLFDVLMGKSVPPRREFLLKYAEEANEL